MGDEYDFVQDIAFWYPLRVILQLIGVPEKDEAHILDLTQRLFSPDEFVTEEQDTMVVFLNAVQCMGEYFTVLTEERRQNPRDDVASLLANAKLDRELIDPFTLTSYFVLLATAGHDTTSASIAGGLHALLTHPEQYQKLLVQPELYASAAEEMIRWVIPVKHFARTALANTELGGQKIAKGDTVVMFFDSASRDDSAIPEPDLFDIARKGNKHLVFGHGRHYCLRMHLARMDITVLMERLLPQLDAIALNGEPSYIPSHFVSGLNLLPVGYRLR